MLSDDDPNEIRNLEASDYWANHFDPNERDHLTPSFSLPSGEDQLNSELYFLLSLFLSASPCQEAFKVFVWEAERLQLLPRRLDWTGEYHQEPFSQLVKDRYSHVPRDLLQRLLAKGQQNGLLDRPMGVDKSNIGQVFGWDAPVIDSIWQRLQKLTLGHTVPRTLDLLADRYRLLRTVQTHFAPAFCIYFDQREERLFTAGDDGIIRVFSLKRGMLIGTLRGHLSQMCDLSIDPTNMYLASGSIDGHICVWNIVNYQAIIGFENGSSVLNLDFHPDPSLGDRPILMCSGGDGQVKYYALDLQMGTVHKPPLSFQCKSLARDEVRCVAFSPGGHRLIAGSTDGIVRLLKTPDRTDIIQGVAMANGVPHVQYLDDHDGCITAACFPDPPHDHLEFITGSWDGTVRRWHFDASKPGWLAQVYDTKLLSGRLKRKVTNISYAANGQLIVVAIAESYSILVFDRVTGKLMHNFANYHRHEVYVMSCHPNISWLVLTAGYDGRIALWDLARGRAVFTAQFTCRWHDGTFSPSGNYFSLVDERGRMSLFGTAIPSDAYEQAAEYQFHPIDWHQLTMDDQSGQVVDIVTREAAIEVGPSINQDRMFNPHQCPPEEVSTEPYTEAELASLVETFQGRLKAEKCQFDLEMAAFPFNTRMKPTRARRKRVVYGSEDEAEQPAAAPLEQREEEEEPVEILAAQTSGLEEEDDDDQPIRAGHRLRRRTGEARRRQRELVTSWIVPLSENSDDEAYRPITANTSRRRPRSSRERATAQTEPASWVTSNDRHSFPYLPQVGDAVVYFPEGHRQFLEKERGVAYRHHLPWQQVARLPNIVFGVIEEVEWFATHTPSMPRCQLKLIMVQEAELPSSSGREELPLNGDLLKVFLEDGGARERLTIVYRECEGVPDFIILHCLYQWSQLKTFRVGDEVDVVFAGEERFPARITRVRRAHHSPWQCYTVEWIGDDDAPQEVSPWELRQQEEAHQCTEMISALQLNAIQENINHCLRDRRLDAFVDPVDYRLYPEYLSVIAYPLCISQIIARLTNNFYRRVESLEWDVRQVRRNAEAFNEPNTPIHRNGEYVERVLLAAIRRSTRGRISRPTTFFSATTTVGGSSSAFASPRLTATRRSTQSTPVFVSRRRSARVLDDADRRQNESEEEVRPVRRRSRLEDEEEEVIRSAKRRGRLDLSDDNDERPAKRRSMPKDDDDEEEEETLVRRRSSRHVNYAENDDEGPSIANRRQSGRHK